MRGRVGVLMSGAMVLLFVQVLWANGFTLSVGSDRRTPDRAIAQTLTFQEASWGQLGFEYQFTQNGGAELWVYLTDDPNSEEALLTPIVHLTAPDDERSGSPESGVMSVFQGDVWISGYDQASTLFLIFELRGKDTVCVIQPRDDCDYDGTDYLIMGGVDVGCGVTCGLTCGDFNGDNVVTVADYLLLVAESGQAVDWNYPCLDLGGDGFVDLIDILSMDMAFHQLNVCGDDSWNEKVGLDTLSCPDGFWLAGGKSDRAGEQDDWLFGVDCNGLGVTESLTGPLVNSEDVPRGYGRLVQDGRGGLYQIHGVHGLVDVQTGTVVVPGQMATWQGRQVRVGLVDGEGKGLLDAAFDPGDPNVVYVVPVQVWSSLSQCPYNVAARLVLDGNESYEVTQIYGLDPMEDPNVTVTSYGCGDMVLEPDVQQLRELELDNHGNLFVTGSQQLNDNDWILVYDVNAGNDSELRVCISEVMEGPGATLLSASGETFYLASSIEAAPGSSPTITRYRIERSGPQVVGLTPEAQTLLQVPSEVLGADGYALITALAEATQGQVTAFGFAAERSNGAEPFTNDDALFTRPFMGSLSEDMPEAVPAVMIENTQMALPLTVIWISENECGFLM